MGHVAVGNANPIEGVFLYRRMLQLGCRCLSEPSFKYLTAMTMVLDTVRHVSSYSHAEVDNIKAQHKQHFRSLRRQASDTDEMILVLPASPSEFQSKYPALFEGIYGEQHPIITPINLSLVASVARGIPCRGGSGGQPGLLKSPSDMAHMLTLGGMVSAQCDSARCAPQLMNLLSPGDHEASGGLGFAKLTHFNSLVPARCEPSTASAAASPLLASPSLMHVGELGDTDDSQRSAAPGAHGPIPRPDLKTGCELAPLQNVGIAATAASPSTDVVDAAALAPEPALALASAHGASIMDIPIEESRTMDGHEASSEDGASRILGDFLTMHWAHQSANRKKAADAKADGKAGASMLAIVKVEQTTEPSIKKPRAKKARRSAPKTMRPAKKSRVGKSTALVDLVSDSESMSGAPRADAIGASAGVSAGADAPQVDDLAADAAPQSSASSEGQPIGSGRAPVNKEVLEVAVADAPNVAELAADTAPQNPALSESQSIGSGGAHAHKEAVDVAAANAPKVAELAADTAHQSSASYESQPIGSGGAHMHDKILEGAVAAQASGASLHVSGGLGTAAAGVAAAVATPVVGAGMSAVAEAPEKDAVGLKPKVRLVQEKSRCQFRVESAKLTPKTRMFKYTRGDEMSMLEAKQKANEFANTLKSD